MSKFSKAPQNEAVKAFINAAGTEIEQAIQKIPDINLEKHKENGSGSGSGINITTTTGGNTSSDILLSNKLSNDLPWEKQNSKSVKKKVFNLRLNQYYIEALRHFSNPEEGISMQSIASAMVTEKLDRMIEEIIRKRKN